MLSGAVLCGPQERPGPRLLIATSAAEEGLDVAACAFVVRYNPPATGVSLAQSAGRARQQDARFHVLLQVRLGVLDQGRGFHARAAMYSLEE